MRAILLASLLSSCSSPADDSTPECTLEVFYLDVDHDGFGGQGTTESCALGPGLAATHDDCDDTHADVHPGAEDVCDNGLDDDCEGGDATGSIWFTDADGDGFGDPATKQSTCTPDAGAVTNGSDCDDTDRDVNPSAAELCDNAIDENCDGQMAGASDVDADGYATPECGGNDCDDASSAIHPDAEDACNDGVDDDCDGADSYCGFDGEYFLSKFGLHYTSSEPSYSAGASVEVGDLDGDGDDDVLLSTVMADAYNGGAFLLRGPLSADGTLQDRALRIESAAETNGAGRSLGIADVNGDGIEDMGLGAPYANEGVYVTYGPVTTDTVVGDADAVLIADSPTSLTCGHGSDLADIDDDGFADAIIGAYSSDAGGPLSGIAFVVFGPLSGDYELLSGADATLVGEAGQLIGQSVRDAQDVDGDGIGDVFINGVYDNTGGMEAGAMFVVAGPPPSGESPIEDIALAKLVGPAPYAHAGYAMASGDVDGDGLPDVIASAQKPGPTAAYMFYSPPASEGFEDADVIIQGDTGVTALAADDLDGDGVDELLLGLSTDMTSEPWAGAAYLAFAPSAGSWTLADVAQAAFYGAATYDQAGAAVKFADMDADGNDDIVIGAPSDGDGGGVLVLLP
jgi:hypothetical protein